MYYVRSGDRYLVRRSRRHSPIGFVVNKLRRAGGNKLLATLALLKEVADPVFGSKEFREWARIRLGLTDDFFKYWEYISTLDMTVSNTNSIVGIVAKQDWFGTFYTTWKTVQANKELNNKISEETVAEISKTIDELKIYLDNENIVY